jgi:diacylglycerol kinase (ATP)
MNDLGHAAATEERALQESKLRSDSPNVFAATEPLRVGVLNNPRSGGNRRGLGAVRKVLAAHPQVSHREVLTPSDVAAALVDFARKEVNVVVVNGGDGTIQAALTALCHHKPFEAIPPLAVLRAGTTSMTAGDVGLKGSREQALRRLLLWAEGGEGEVGILHRPVLRVQVDPHQDPIYGMFLGAASIYQGIQFFNNRLNRRGFRGEWAPGLTIALFLLAVARRGSDYVTPVPIRVGFDQRSPERRDYLLLMISALERLFLGMHPFWGREERTLHYTAVEARPQHLLRALPALMRGRRNRYGTPDNGYFSHNVQQVQLTFNSGFTLDGELFKAESHLGPVVVQNGGKVSFLRL